MSVNTDELARRFEQAFGGSKATHVVRAPGRVNLIGEHTDYNDGFVLPIAMSQALYVAAGPGDDDAITVRSTAFDETVTLPIDTRDDRREPRWANYVRGMAALLPMQGVKLRPAKLLIHSEIPIGGGVSSSAALEIGVGKAMLAVADTGLEPTRLAMVAQQAEHSFAGSPCGIMDQYICALGRKDHAFLLDCRSRDGQHVPFRFDDAVLLVMDTQVKRSLASSEYARRRQECESAVWRLKGVQPVVRALRDVSPEVLKANQAAVGFFDYRRCLHVVTEIERTVRASEALSMSDPYTFGRLMSESHQSLSSDYEVSSPELDALVQIAMGVPGVYGARMTGAGFGGCAIALLRREAEQPLREAVKTRYDTRFQKPAIVYATTASDGATVHPL